MAFTPEGLRLWKPYQPEQFGGSRRSGDGLYGSLEGILWKVDGPKNIPVGYRNPDGSSGSRKAYDGNKTFTQTNSMSTRELDAEFALGTRLEIGNIRGHHGWLLSGYGLSDCNASFEQRNGTMVIRDPENLTSYAVYWSSGAFNEIWQPDGTFKRIAMSETEWKYLNDLSDGLPQVPIENVGHFWGWFPIQWSNPWLEGRLAPLPLNFDRAQVNNSVDLISLELMYNYRPHPFKWGEMDLYAGVRYWDFDDKLTFLGQGFIEAYEEWEEQNLNTGDNNNNNNNSSNSNNNNNNNNNNGDDSVLGEVNSNELGPLSIMADTTIVGHARNRIVGPQFGVKLSRRNARWTFGAEARFMAGINSQSQTVNGTLGSHFIDTSRVPQIGGGSTSGSSSGSGSGGGTNLSIQNHGILPYIPIGLHHNTQSFYHHRTKTEFSPGVELRLNAKWQWTDAVGVQFGFNTTIFDNIARGADIIDYSVMDNGQLFGIRSSKTSVIVYGFNFGLSMRR